MLFLTVVLCPAQQATPNINISPRLAFNIEAELFSEAELPSGTSLTFGARSASEIPGYDNLAVRYITVNGEAGSIALLISKDDSHLAQFTVYDIGGDPKAKFTTGDKPSRGGPASAPVLIVVYDDLQCPFCARLHAEIFPTLIERYKDQVRIVYRSFPLEGHPWAMRAAIDVDCLGGLSGPAYWAAVDRIHAHVREYSGLQTADAQKEIDLETATQGRAFKVDEARLAGCIARQNADAEIASVKQGEKLGVKSTPTLFINGLKVEGAQPLAYIFGVIDDALRAEGRTPPVPYVADSAPHSPDEKNR